MRNNKIDFFRGIAIIMVVYGHLIGFYLGEKSQLRIFDAKMGVWIFFIISGYLMYDRVIESKTIFSFWKKRVVRILPLSYLLFLLHNVTNFKVYIFAVDFGKIDGLVHIWSLKRELIFYLILPLVFALQKKLNFRCLMELYIALSPIFIFLDFHTSIKYVEFGYYYNVLFIGCLTRKYFAEITSWSNRVQLAHPSILVLIFLFSLLSWRYIDLPLMGGLLLSMLIFSFLFVISLAMIFEQRILNIGALKFGFHAVSRVGRISFSIYIFQQYFTQQEFPVSIQMPGNEFLYLPINSILNILILLIISILSFFFMEKKLHSFLTNKILKL